MEHRRLANKELSQTIMDILRAHRGHLPSRLDGGPITYLTADREPMCYECAKEQLRALESCAHPRGDCLCASYAPQDWFRGWATTCVYCSI